jgi:hypothetical protein
LKKDEEKHDYGYLCLYRHSNFIQMLDSGLYQDESADAEGNISDNWVAVSMTWQLKWLRTWYFKMKNVHLRPLYIIAVAKCASTAIVP